MLKRREGIAGRGVGGGERPNRAGCATAGIAVPCHFMSPSPRTPSADAAGRHLLIECFGTHAGLDETALEALMREAAGAGGAQVLSCHMHRFGPGQGVTGVALLAESHVTVHTWPERGYAAFDIFMCGECDAERAAQVIARAAPEAHVAIRALQRPALADGKEGE